MSHPYEIKASIDLEEKPILNAKNAVPDAAPYLKKLANGVYGQKIKKMDERERLDFLIALDKLTDILKRK